jgi:DMSO/TMAO reductase YedYZ molybdopterin-dependent catalytic subunit
MWTRRIFLRSWLWAFLCTFSLNSSLLWKRIPSALAKTKQLLPKGFSKHQLINMNPEEIDNQNLEIDRVDQFGTMGPTEVSIDLKTYQFKVTGKVGRPLSLSYDQILEFPSLTESVLLICPGFFANNGRWTGIHLKVFLREAQVKKDARYLDIHGLNEKSVRIPLETIDQKKIFLAYRVNGEPLPQKHGFPLRLVYEDAYGYDWVKYVDEMVVL